MNELIQSSEISSRIFTIRGIEIMLDRDLAELYGVTTKALNQAVKRNIKRFPSDFIPSLPSISKPAPPKVLLANEAPRPEGTRYLHSSKFNLP